MGVASIPYPNLCAFHVECKPIWWKICLDEVCANVYSTHYTLCTEQRVHHTYHSRMALTSALTYIHTNFHSPYLLCCRVATIFYHVPYFYCSLFGDDILLPLFASDIFFQTAYILKFVNLWESCIGFGCAEEMCRAESPICHLESIKHTCIFIKYRAGERVRARRPKIQRKKTKRKQHETKRKNKSRQNG